MLAFHLFNYKILVDPVYAFQLLNHMWATEPVGTLSICITFTSVVLTLGFKVLDILWDIYKERAHRGKLRIELSAKRTQGQSSVHVVISNRGKEPIVVRDVGYKKRHWLGSEFVPVLTHQANLPHALNARNLVQVTVVEEETESLNRLLSQFRVQDSLGKLWVAPDSEIRKAKRQLNALVARSSGQPVITQAALEDLENDGSPISTHN